MLSVGLGVSAGRNRSGRYSWGLLKFAAERKAGYWLTVTKVCHERDQHNRSGLENQHTRNREKKKKDG
jgi:hypothetical protein